LETAKYKPSVVVFGKVAEFCYSTKLNGVCALVRLAYFLHCKWAQSSIDIFTIAALVIHSHEEGTLQVGDWRFSGSFAATNDRELAATNGYFARLDLVKPLPTEANSLCHFA
jgi:hypothetical protein